MMWCNCLLLAAISCQKLAFAQAITGIYSNASAANYGATETYGNNTYVKTYLEPIATASQYAWIQVITPAILGTVLIIVNDHNQTKTSTITDSAAVSSNTQYLVNGTLSLLTRTDINENNTVTALVVTSAAGWTTQVDTAGITSYILTASPGFATVAYPTPYFAAPDSIQWNGVFPGSLGGSSCCWPHNSYSATPMHNPFPSSTGSTNKNDPTGWLYSLESNATFYEGSQSVSSLYAPATINSVIQTCPLPLCVAWSTAAAETAVQAVGALFATSTVTVSGTFSTAAPASPQVHTMLVTSTASKTSVEVDPISLAAPTSPTSESKNAPPSNTVSQQSNPSSASKTSVEADPISLAAPTSPVSESKNAPPSPTVSQQSNLTPSSLTNQFLSEVPSMPGPTTAKPPPSSNVQASSADQHSQNVQPAVVSVGTTSYNIHPTQLETIVSGSSRIIGGYVVGTQTAAIGSTVFEGSTPVVVYSSASHTYIVVGSSTVTVPQAANTTPEPGHIVVGSQTITANSNSQYIISDQTLAVGSSVTIGSGTQTTVIGIHTAASSNTVLIIGTSTSTLESPHNPPAPPLTLGSAVITPDSHSEYIVGSQTLVPGASAITIAGVEYSLASGASEVIIGSKTDVLTSEVGLGSYIWNALGGVSATPTSTPGAASVSGTATTATNSSTIQKSSAVVTRSWHLLAGLCLFVWIVSNYMYI